MGTSAICPRCNQIVTKSDSGTGPSEEDHLDPWIFDEHNFNDVRLGRVKSNGPCLAGGKNGFSARALQS